MTDHGPAGDRPQVAPVNAYSEDGSGWGARLWDDDWEGETGLFGETRLCVATKKWEDGTEDVLVAHNPYAGEGMPFAYAHRHGERVAPVAVHGLAHEVVEIVTNVWGPP